jgi:hypothetical protein
MSSKCKKITIRPTFLEPDWNMGIPELETGNTEAGQFHTEVVANGNAFNFHLVIPRRVRKGTLAFQADSLRESIPQPLVVNKNLSHQLAQRSTGKTLQMSSEAAL